MGNGKLGCRLKGQSHGSTDWHGWKSLKCSVTTRASSTSACGMLSNAIPNLGMGPTSGQEWCQPVWAAADVDVDVDAVMFWSGAVEVTTVLLMSTVFVA